MWLLAASCVWDCLIFTLIYRAVVQSRYYAGLPGANEPPADAGSISVIIPARNEGENITQCVDSLLAQTWPASGMEILVVDDHSTDQTATEVRRLAYDAPRVRLLSSRPLPRGWTGKSHACWQGALAAGGQWLCFLDADTIAEPALLTSAVACAHGRGLGMLSLSPRQQLDDFFSRLLIPAGVLVVAFTQDLRQINENDPAHVSANGQFLLFPRELYFALGGHGSVRNEICEDRALARQVKQAGKHFLLLGADDFIHTRMYTSWCALWEGFSKNVTETFGGIGRTVCISLGMFVIGWAAYLGPLAVWHFAPSTTIACVALAIWLLGSVALAAIHIATARHFQAPAPYVFLFPLSYTLGAAIAIHGVYQRLAGSVPWKGRRYSTLAPNPDD